MASADVPNVATKEFIMTISVLMSVYRSESADHLAEALRSVWDDQTLKPTQIVLIEDGLLPDDLHGVINDCQKRVEQEGGAFTICRNEQNVGLTKSLNVGLRAVTGELVARMDSDDRSAPERFELQERYLREHPDVDVCGGALQEFDANNDCLNVRHYPLTHEECARYIVKASPFAHPSVMMRRRMFDEGLHYDERYRMSQDIQLWYDALLSGHQFGNIPDVCLYFRREGDVFKRRSKAKAKNEFIIYMRGIYRMKGLFTLAYAYPLARYVFRNLPVWAVKRVYGSGLRNQVLKK